MKPQPLKALRYFIFVLLFSANAALAQSQSLYAVNDVVINASGKSPSDARGKAVAAGQRSAFLILLQRLEIDESAAASLKDDAIDDMVASKQIIDEKIAGNNYSATLNLTFSSSFIKHYLGQKINAQVDSKTGPKTEITEASKPNSFLLIPIKIVKNQPSIWEENNDWKTALENSVKNNKISSIKLLKGDIDDIGVFNAATIKDGNFADFEAGFNKYKVDALLLLFFEFDSIENKVDITLKTIRKFQNDQVYLDFVNVNQLSMADLVGKVADKTVGYLISNVLAKNDNPLAQIPTPSAPAVLNTNIDVLVSDLSNWLTIKNKLENSNVISGLKVNSISRDLVKINVAYNNANGEIVSFFAKHNLLLQKKPEGGYFLSLMGIAQK